MKLPFPSFSLTALLLFGGCCPAAVVVALDGGTVRLSTYNSWKAFEVISQGDTVNGWTMPSTFDGAGAYLVDANTLRIQTNHETGDATISEVDINLSNFQTAISNMISNGNIGGVSFVTNAQQAYDRWSANGGGSWTATSSPSNTAFYRFCSSQAYKPNTFGANRGFVDQVYITGEEGSTNRLFALDSANRDLYQLSGVTGSASGGIGGMSFDAWENAALVDTGETGHVALVLSPDGGSQNLKLYIGEKGKDANGNTSNSFLARNGLHYGSWYYFKGSYPSLGGTNSGSFDTSQSGALGSTKLEDVDTSPSDPTKFVLGDQDSGVFTFDLTLDFSSGSFNAGASSFTITKIDNAEGQDNVDWSDATTLGGTTYAGGLIFVNEDNTSGEVWMMTPDGSGQTRIASTTVGAESTGVFDLSELVGYKPASILICNNQGSPASMSVLINPNAELLTGGPPPPTPTAPPPTPTVPPPTPTVPPPSPTPVCIEGGQGLGCDGSTNCCAGVGQCTSGNPASRVCLNDPSAPSPTPASGCGGNKATCSSNADCCSGNCNGGTCKGNRFLRFGHEDAE